MHNVNANIQLFIQLTTMSVHNNYVVETLFE